MPDGSCEKYPTPRRLATSEIPEIVEQYRQFAIKAIEAGKRIHLPQEHDAQDHLRPPDHPLLLLFAHLEEERVCRFRWH